MYLPSVKKLSRIILAFAVIIAGLFVLGPSVENMSPINPSLPPIKAEIEGLSKLVVKHESTYAIRDGCSASIHFYNKDSIPRKTRYSVLYLHGFSATHEEGNPTSFAVANKLRANLYLSRLHAHGLKEQEPLINYNADSTFRSAQYAYAIAKELGDSVVIAAVSTGATLALKLAALYPEIAGLMLYSPNIEIADPTAKLLNDPWGLEIAQFVFGSNYKSYDAPPLVKQFWDTKYRLEALPQLQELLENTMTEETFQHVTCPVFLGYYYKSEDEQDQVVSVDAMLSMFQQLGTPVHLKEKVAFPNAGDHVITSVHKTADYPAVISASNAFIETHFKIPSN